MSDQDFQSYVGSYKNIVHRGLGDKYQLQARNFEVLFIAERGESMGNKMVIKTLASVKFLLDRALVDLSKTTEFSRIRPHLVGWQQEIELADSATKLGVISKRVSELMLSLVPN